MTTHTYSRHMMWFLSQPQVLQPQSMQLRQMVTQMRGLKNQRSQERYSILLNGKVGRTFITLGKLRKHWSNKMLKEWRNWTITRRRIRKQNDGEYFCFYDTYFETVEVFHCVWDLLPGFEDITLSVCAMRRQKLWKPKLLLHVPIT